MRRLVWPLAAAFVLTSLPFSAWTAPPASALSVYRLPTGAYQLLVRPGQAALERTGGVGGDRRVLVVTVPVVPGVSLESGVFPSFESLAGHVMAAYAEASRLDTSTPHACSAAAPSGASAGSKVSDVIDQPPSAPRLFHVLPTAGPAFMPIAIGGTNFGVGTIPYVNGTPSVALFNWSCQNIPLIGSISVGFTIVPPAAPSGAGDVVVEYFGQRSNPFPFTKTPFPAPPASTGLLFDTHNHWPVGMTAAQLVAVLDQQGVSKVVLMQNGSGQQPPLPAADAYPDRVIPFAGFASQRHTRAEIDAIESQLATGRYRGIGEVLSLHYAFTEEGGPSAPHVEIAADSTWVGDLLCLAAKYSVVLTIHMESTAETVPALARALRGQPQARVIWAHQTPLKTFGGQTAADARKADPGQLAALLADLPNLHADIAPGYEGFFFDPSVDGKLPEAWKSLYERFSDRFVVGFDQPFAQGWTNPGGYARRVSWVRGWLSQLAPAVQARFATENAERLFAARPQSGLTCQLQTR